MTNPGSDKWFTFLLALIVVFVTAFGAMNLYMHDQQAQKIDRVTRLFMSEKAELSARFTEVYTQVLALLVKMERVDTLQREQLERERSGQGGR